MAGNNKGKKGGAFMAVEKVTASMADETTQLQNTENSTYTGSLEAPSEGGEYSLEISAYDDSGNVSVISSEIEVSIWHTPKTDWKSTDRFNFVDYNRIKNNLLWLHEKVSELYRPFEIEDMGMDITDYLSYWKVQYFNAWEKNLDIINNHMFSRDYGVAQRFFENGPFIQWMELNRIENAILNMRDILERQEAGIRRLSFRFGKFKEVSI